MNIALLSPNKNAYSETFIQAHKEMLAGTIFFYYSGILPTKLEGGVVINSRKKRIIDILKGHYRLNKFSLEEKALITSFRNNNIDVVLAEYGDTGIKILRICEELGLPLIVHFHGYDASRKDQMAQIEDYKKVFDYACNIVVVSNKMYRTLLQMGCPEEKLVYNVYGPREDFQKIVPNFSKPQFIAIGRFVDKKAPYYLILAFQKVVEVFPEAKLVIAGEGELWNSCKNLVNFYKLKKNVILPGIISKEDYSYYLRESFAMVQHSIIAEDGDSEGTPLAILEASAAGLPVISTKHAGIPDVIIHGETGYLVEEHDVAGMANEMIKVLQNRELARNMGEKGKANILNNFQLKRHIQVLNELLETAVS